MVWCQLLREIRLPRAADCRNELRVALGVSVVSVARLRVEVCLFNDGLVSGKIGVADGKVDDIVVFGQCLGVEREPGARVLKAVCDVAFHVHRTASLQTWGTTVAPFGMT